MAARHAAPPSPSRLKAAAASRRSLSGRPSLHAAGSTTSGVQLLDTAYRLEQRLELIELERPLGIGDDRLRLVQDTKKLLFLLLISRLNHRYHVRELEPDRICLPSHIEIVPTPITREQIGPFDIIDALGTRTTWRVLDIVPDVVQHDRHLTNRIRNEVRPRDVQTHLAICLHRRDEHHQKGHHDDPEAGDVATDDGAELLEHLGATSLVKHEITLVLASASAITWSTEIPPPSGGYSMCVRVQSHSCSQVVSAP